jgi:hypothetical protein
MERELMRNGGFLVSLIVICVSACAFAQKSQSATGVKGKSSAAGQKLEDVLAAKVKTEWDAFKTRNKKAYSDLLADDFVGVEDDGEGTRNRYKAANEIDNSNINDYKQNFFKVFALNSNTALVTYELTFLFPPKAAVRYKRVYISEIWLKQDGQWKLRHYQETPVK